MGPSFTFFVILTSLPKIISSSISFSQTLSMNYTLMGKPSVIGWESWLGGQGEGGDNDTGCLLLFSQPRISCVLKNQTIVSQTHLF